MPKRRGNTRDTTKMVVWGRAGGRCQYRNCNERLDGDLVSGNLARNKSYVAHIVAADPGGERGDPVLSFELADDPENLMLMCDAHHREIDDTEKLNIYTVEILREMKREHEMRVDQLLSIRTAKKSKILQVSAPIGENETAVSFDDCTYAVTSESILADRVPVEIKIRGMRHKDTDPDYYNTEISNLRSRFDREIRGQYEDGLIEHLSVFGLAPIPILMELGRLISDISDATVFMRHREPKPQWAWPNDGPSLSFSRSKGPAESNKVALKLSVSADINDERVNQVLGDDVSIWEIRSNRFGTGVLRNHSDLTGYRLLVGRVFDEIREQHGKEAELSVFPAIPIACAIEFGRVWQPKAHPGFRIFDETQAKGFIKRHEIGTMLSTSSR
ncbi:hypothetical protein FIV00_15655 [Labrenzia sp. THAF82]|uniref:SAVED domain-containing protein n=1 Tax=Labrenzia sp. THAF82 TaxID=2587861 RepID=UPI00126791F2|nr:SAVED domain-containing protein [Labrenzia sp. THAF82]QFT31929.1 hypothetical protein FIV00_15655 [Labrenzia sp. THAF82]